MTQKNYDKKIINRNIGISALIIFGYFFLIFVSWVTFMLAFQYTIVTPYRFTVMWLILVLLTIAYCLGVAFRSFYTVTIDSVIGTTSDTEKEVIIAVMRNIINSNKIEKTKLIDTYELSKVKK